MRQIIPTAPRYQWCLLLIAGSLTTEVLMTVAGLLNTKVRRAHIEIAIIVLLLVSNFIWLTD